MQKRFFRQAWQTLYENLEDMRGGYLINAFNKKIDKSGICPTITTRPEGFKTAILVVVDAKNRGNA